MHFGRNRRRVSLNYAVRLSSTVRHSSTTIAETVPFDVVRYSLLKLQGLPFLTPSNREKVDFLEANLLFSS